MDIEFLEGTKVAIADNILSDEDCIILRDYAIETKLKETEESRKNLPDIGQSSKGSFLQLDKDIEYTLDDLVDFWGSKNVFTYFAPPEVSDVVTRLKKSCVKAFSQYLKDINHTKTDCDIDDMQFQAIHVYSAGHKFETHIDCFEFALVFYMSDPSEFEGGDLIYEAGPRITPARGRLVMSPSEMPHEVLEVTSGYRCSMTTFLFMPRTPRDQWAEDQ
jgi:hypothetical protein